MRSSGPDLPRPDSTPIRGGDSSFVERHLIRRSLLSYLLYPFSLPYGLAVRTRRILHRIIPPAPTPGRARIVVIGNLTAGGSGKTPFTACLTRRLTDHGRKCAICLRGYRGAYERENRLVADREGLLPGANQAGDEALMLARQLPGIPVAVGGKRRRSIELLTRAFPDLDVILLDDGFQHLAIRPHFRYVVVNLRTGIGNGFLLPAGILREPVSALRDADAVVINGEGDAGALLGKLRYRGPVLQGSMRLHGIRNQEGDPAEIRDMGDRVLLLTGIGSPEGFRRSMEEAEIPVVGMKALPDHDPFTDPGLWDELRERQRKGEFTALLVTEKDAVKIRTDLPLFVAVSRFECEGDPLETLMSALGRDCGAGLIPIGGKPC